MIIKLLFPFPKLYSKNLLNPINFERENKISLREMNEIISDIHMLFAYVENNMRIILTK